MGVNNIFNNFLYMGNGHCVFFLIKTLISEDGSFHSNVQMGNAFYRTLDSMDYPDPEAQFLPLWIEQAKIKLSVLDFSLLKHLVSSMLISS